MTNLLLILFIYTGLVQDQKGNALPYTTVYSEMHPEIGTATGPDGLFRLETEEEIYGDFIFSFIGYEKHSDLAFYYLDTTRVVRLKEQPIALEETVIQTKRTKNKRKRMRALLAEVYAQMLLDFDSLPVYYKVVSDMRLDQDSVPWGVEQVIGDVLEYPYQSKNGFPICSYNVTSRRRFLADGLREKADAFKKSDALERMDKAGKKRYDLKWTVQNVDSGTVMYKSLWRLYDVVKTFEQYKNSASNWTVKSENEGETVLTHLDKKDYLGIFKYEYYTHFILNSDDLSVKKFSQQAEVWIHIPFGGYKLTKDQLQMLNLLNLSDRDIELFRLRRAHATIMLNTIYVRKNGKNCKLEKNLVADGLFTGSPKSTIRTIPINIKATQRATYIQPYKR